MSHYIIFCGSETDPESWRPIQSLLEAGGHTCKLPSWTAVDWKHGVDFAVEQIADEIGLRPDPILVGHSIAGLLLPALADRLGAHSEIYIAALYPAAARSFFDRLFAGEEVFEPQWTEGYQDLSLSDNPQSTHRIFLRHHLFHDCPASSVDSCWSRSTLPIHLLYDWIYPVGSFTPRYRHSIVSGEDRSLRPAWQRLAARPLCGNNETVIDTGHCPHISRPQLLADLLVTVGAQAYQEAAAASR